MSTRLSRIRNPEPARYGYGRASNGKPGGRSVTNKESGPYCPVFVRVMKKGTIRSLLPIAGVTLLAFFAVAILGTNRASATDPDTFSPVVSFQYQESLETTVGVTIQSPVVSFQFYEWPGDENLTFTNSPSASYYFGGGTALAFSGIVADTSGMPVTGAQVILQRYNTPFWQGYTASNGSISAATLPAGNFNVIVIKSGYTRLFQSVAGDTGGSVFLNLTLQPAGMPPALTAVVRDPAKTAIRALDPPNPNLPRPPGFMVFTGNGFSNSGPINPNRMTVVISHGWNPSGGNALSSWATTLAFQIQNSHALGANVPNIIAWDWSARASAPLPPIDEARIQGEYLGQALQKVLGTGYQQRVHFIGHSLGTIVNAYACDYVHGASYGSRNNAPVAWNIALTQPHVTLLDEAKSFTVFGQNVISAAAVAWKVAQLKGALIAGTAAVVSDWKNPVPNASVWADNYISLVGMQHDNCVNIGLPAIARAYDIRHPVSGLEDAHAYSHSWYRNSIGATGSYPQVGFRQSYEKALTFPPTGTGLGRGSLWMENLETPDPMDLSLVQSPSGFEAQQKILGFLTVSAASQVGSLPGLAGQSVLNGYESGLKWVGNIGGSAILKTGQVLTQNSEKIGNLWDAALDAGSMINPEVNLTKNIVVPTWKLIMSTASPNPVPRSRSGIVYAPAVAIPPQAWVPVQVPEDAAFLAFDFTVTGDPSDDQIVCAINEQNLFTLPARFAPDGSPVSTDFLDVSAYAGQQVELYFGLVGGTSSGCSLAVDGLRFVTIPMPKLAAEVANNQVSLKWPVAASGWVPQRNASLDPQTWEDIPLDGTTSTLDGIVIVNRPQNGTREFFRLRRVE